MTQYCESESGPLPEDYQSELKSLGTLLEKVIRRERPTADLDKHLASSPAWLNDYVSKLDHPLRRKLPRQGRKHTLETANYLFGISIRHRWKTGRTRPGNKRSAGRFVMEGNARKPNAGRAPATSRWELLSEMAVAYTGATGRSITSYPESGFFILVELILRDALRDMRGASARSVVMQWCERYSAKQPVTFKPS